MEVWLWPVPPWPQFFVLQLWIVNLIRKFRVKAVKVTDQRVGLMSEILNSIRFIKMYAWEDIFVNKIAGKLEYLLY